MYKNTMLENIKKLINKSNNRPTTATIVRIDNLVADITLAPGSGTIRNVEIRGDASKLAPGDKVTITWINRPGGYLAPVILSTTGQTITGTTTSNLSISEDDLRYSLDEMGLLETDISAIDPLLAAGWVAENSSLVSTSGALKLYGDGRIYAGQNDSVVIIDTTDASYRMWAGNYDPASADTVFKIGVDGKIYSTAGEIGGWNIGTEQLDADSGQIVLNSTVPYIGLGSAAAFGDTGIWLGKDVDDIYKVFVGNSAGTYLSWDGTDLVVIGEITAETGSIGGWNIGEDQLDADTAQIILNSATPFIGLGGADTYGEAGIWFGKDVDLAYKVYIGDPTGSYLSWDGTDLTIVGDITATSIEATVGEIGGWTIGEDDISSGNISLSSATPAIAIEATGYMDAGIWFGKDVDDAYKFSIGDGLTKYIAWDGTDLVVGGSIVDGGELKNLDISGLLTIGTDGEIRQGTGTLGVDFTGLRVWNDTGIGRIGGYSADELQWYADTDGTFYAGGGDVRLSDSGISINSIQNTTWTDKNIIKFIDVDNTDMPAFYISSYTNSDPYPGASATAIIGVNTSNTGDGVDYSSTELKITTGLASDATGQSIITLLASDETREYYTEYSAKALIQLTTNGPYYGTNPSTSDIDMVADTLGIAANTTLQGYFDFYEFDTEPDPPTHSRSRLYYCNDLFKISSPITSIAARDGIELYVAKTGDDGNAGTIGYPLLTIQAALDRLKGSTTYKDVVIYIGAGEYNEALDISGIACTFTEDLKIIGDGQDGNKKTLGQAFVHGSTSVSTGTGAYDGDGTVSLSADNSGTGGRMRIRIQRSTTNPDFDADGIDNTNGLSYYRGGSATTYNIYSVSNEYITLDTTAAAPSLNTNGYFVVILPNVSVIDTSEAAAALVVSGVHCNISGIYFNGKYRGVQLIKARCVFGWCHLDQTDTGTDYWGTADLQDSTLSLYPVDASSTSWAPLTMVGNRGACRVGPQSTLTAPFVTFHSKNNNYNLFCNGGWAYVDSSQVAKNTGTGYYSNSRGYILANSTNANNFATTKYSPSTSNTFGNNNSCITFS